MSEPKQCAVPNRIAIHGPFPRMRGVVVLARQVRSGLTMVPNSLFMRIGEVLYCVWKTN